MCCSYTSYYPMHHIGSNLYTCIDGKGFGEAFVQHPRDIIPPFTHAMMKKDPDRVECCFERHLKAKRAASRRKNAWRRP